MNFIPYSIFVHYTLDYQETIKKQSNKVKNQFLFEKQEEALMEIIRNYNK
jgi:hypothetical protein